MGVKIAPIASRDILIGVVVIGGAYVMWIAAKSFKENLSDASAAVSDFIHGGAVSAAAGAVDTRKAGQDPNELSFGGVQQAVSDAVQRGQEAGATNFVSAYFKGLFL